MTASHAAYCSTETPGRNNNIRVHGCIDNDVYELARHHWNYIQFFFLDFFFRLYWTAEFSSDNNNDRNRMAHTSFNEFIAIDNWYNWFNKFYN